ncbi:MAG: hypothetical protein ACRDRJ_00815 [Streptosporangiaceae bacterium]
MIEAVYNQWEILEQRALLARAFLEDHPDIRRDLERGLANSAAILYQFPDRVLRQQYLLSFDPPLVMFGAYPYYWPFIHYSQSELVAALSLLETRFPGAAPYVDFLAELIKTIELEKLAAPYL